MIKILFMGRKQVSANCLSFLDSLSNVEVVGVLTDSHLDQSPTTEVATKLGLTIYNYDTALKAMKDKILIFDLGLSLLYWRKLKEEFLTIPSLGVINFHPAPLPDYKGTGGYNLAILDELETWAVSAHYVDEEIDTGDIIKVASFPINPEDETVISLEKESTVQIELLFKTIVKKAIRTNNPLSSIANIGGRYVSRNEMESMKEIKETDNINRKIRAFWFPPYDGAYILINGEKYTLVNRDILNDLAPKGTTSLFSKSS